MKQGDWMSVVLELLVGILLELGVSKADYDI